MTPLAFLTLLEDCLEKWPGLRQLRQRLFDLRVETILSHGMALKVEPKYSGCFSDFQIVQLLFALAVNEAYWCGCLTQQIGSPLYCWF